MTRKHPAPSHSPVERLRRLILGAPDRPPKGGLPGSPLGRPLYRTIVGFDIASFGRRDEHVQNYLRAAMYARLKQAFADAGLPWPAQPWREDRGDGALMIVPADTIHRVLDPLVPRLYAGLRQHNDVSSQAAQMMLRMAVHAGFVYRDEHGLSGEAIVLMYRLLDAPAFKEAVSSRQAVLGLVVSRYVYDNVVRRNPGLVDSDRFRKLLVVNKETTTEAWTHLRSRVAALPVSSNGWPPATADVAARPAERPVGGLRDRGDGPRRLG
jgi:hypothetical protein